MAKQTDEWARTYLANVHPHKTVPVLAEKILEMADEISELRKDLFTCCGHAADIIEGKDTLTGEALDGIGNHIKLLAICRTGEAHMPRPAPTGDE